MAIGDRRYRLTGVAASLVSALAMPAPAFDAALRGQHRGPMATEPIWVSLPLEPDSLVHYGRSLGLQDPATALEALARAIAASAGWPPATGAMIVGRVSPRPLMAVWGRFSAGDDGALGAQARVLDSACRHLRYVGYEEAAVTTEKLAARLLEHLGRDQIRQARFTAVPRGGLVVLGLLAVILGLEPEQLGDRSSPAELLVVVDDCALSGARSAQVLERHDSRRVIFAHLYSHRHLRSAIEEREPRVLACLAARELMERRDEEPLPVGWRRRWSERGAGECYWIGRPETLCFPWGEPDRSVWDPVRKRVERAWRVVPPGLCLKNRPPADVDAVRVQVQPEGSGSLRPAARVLFGEVEGSIVLGNFASGESFVLEGVAADIWRGIARRGDVPSVVADLAGEYQAPRSTLLRDVQAFVARLTGQGLLQDFGPAPAVGRAPELQDGTQ